MFRQAIAMYEATLPATHTSIGIAKIKLGRAILRLGRFAEAEVESRAGYEILAPQLNPTASWLVSARADLATAYDSLGRRADAVSWRVETESVSKLAKK